jgi:hypothetical protein
MFGKLPFTPDHRDLKLAKYIDSGVLIDVAMAPLGADWTAMRTPTGGLPTPDTDPLYNEKAGCCVFSAPGHMVNLVGQQTANSALVVTAGMVQKAYSAATGYNPVTGENDNGYYVREMLKAWQKTGLYGTKCLAFAAVNWRDEQEVALANWIAGGTIGGYNLPSNIWDQEESPGKFTWTVPPGGFPSDAGGHCMYQHGQRNWNTWGCSAIASPGWTNARTDELWIVLLAEWKMASGRAPDGFDFAQLLADVKARQAA